MWHLMVLALDGRISELGISAILNIIMGVCWLLVYILVIIRASSDKTYAMPYAAMCANFS